MSKIWKAVSAGGAFLLPMVALAQVDPLYIDSFFTTVTRIINVYLIPIVIGIALLVFLWGVMKYVTSGGDSEKRKEAANTMLYGIIALAVMVSVWGLVGIVRQIAGVRDVAAPRAPVAPSAGQR
jgi:hypothetical protein